MNYTSWLVQVFQMPSVQFMWANTCEWSWLFRVELCSSWVFTRKLHSPSVTHIPSESGCQSPELWTSSQHVVVVSVQLCCHTNLQLMTYLSAALWEQELFFESGWEIKILISSAGLLCCLQGRIYRLWEHDYVRCARLASHQTLTCPPSFTVTQTHTHCTATVLQFI